MTNRWFDHPLFQHRPLNVVQGIPYSSSLMKMLSQVEDIGMRYVDGEEKIVVVVGNCLIKLFDYAVVDVSFQFVL